MTLLDFDCGGKAQRNFSYPGCLLSEPITCDVNLPLMSPSTRRSGREDVQNRADVDRAILCSQQLAFIDTLRQH